MQEKKLAEREIYLLGVLAQRKGKPLIPARDLPRGCDTAQLQTLVGAGYAISVTSSFADGSQELTYEITQLGLQVWNGFQFFL
jgi:hypothetical protein